MSDDTPTYDGLLGTCLLFEQVNGAAQHINRVGVADEICEATVDRWNALVERVIDMPARDRRERLAKASVLREVLRMHRWRPGRGLVFPETSRQEDELAWSLAHDVLGEATTWPECLGESSAPD